MPNSSLPTIRDLKKLNLRFAIALSLRATQRVSNLSNKSGVAPDNVSENIEEKAFNVGMLLIKSFCDGTLRRVNSQLSEMMDGNKWEPINDNSSEISNHVLRAGNYIFTATMKAGFGHKIEDDLPTLTTANAVIELLHKSLSSALDAAIESGERFKLSFIQEIANDFRVLESLSNSLFPEIGLPVDITLDGPLGGLWKIPFAGTLGCPSSELISDPLEPNLPQPISPIVRAFPASKDSPQEGYLYKYVSFETLQKILDESTLRFSQISRFNDPFDGQILPIRKFTWKQFFTALRDEVSRLVKDEKEPIYRFPEEVPSETSIAVVAKLVIELLESKKMLCFSPEKFDDRERVEPLAKLLRPMIYLAQRGRLGPKDKAVEYLNGLLDLFENENRKFPVQQTDRRIIPAIADIIHVLCLSEVPDSLLMWAHYADNHEGAVLKFDLLRDEENYFSSAKPISYHHQLPSVEQPRDLARRYLGLSEQNSDTELIHRQFLTKSAEWSYEKEWRTIATIQMLENGEYISFSPNSLSAIYLGCRMTPENSRRVLDLVVEKGYPTDVYLTVKDENDFALSFIPLSNGRSRIASMPKLSLDERGLLYRRCLDVYFDYWNNPFDSLVVNRQLLKAEAILGDYGPLGSTALFRNMIAKIKETIESCQKTTVNKSEDPEEYERQQSAILKPSIEVYIALEDMLSQDMIASGGILPIRDESSDIVIE